MSLQRLFVGGADEGRLVQGALSEEGDLFSLPHTQQWIDRSTLVSGLGIKQPQWSDPFLFTTLEEEYNSSWLSACALGELTDS